MQLTHGFITTVRVGSYVETDREIELISDTERPLSYDLFVPVQGTQWTFARSLLSDAFEPEGVEIGEGDVRSQVLGSEFLLTLSPPEGEAATIVFPSLAVLDFILESDALIPAQRVDEIVASAFESFLATLTEE